MNGSSKPVLCLERLEIRQFAGVSPKTAFTLDSFSPQINIIYGPNGCGKTTTAKAIQHLLWPDPSSRYCDLNATVQQEGSPWTLHGRGDHVAALKDGVSRPHPKWAAADTRSRYHWSLQNLLQDQDQDLARQIAREMAGGIDFNQLASDLEWQKTPSAPLKLHQKYLEAKRRVQEATQKQQGIKNEAEKREQLELELQAAIKRYSQEDSLKMAIECSEKRKQFATLHEQMNEAPSGMEKLRGDDAEQLDLLLRKRAELEETARSLQTQRREWGGGEDAWAMFDIEAFRSARKEMQMQLEELKDLREQLRRAEANVLEVESRERDLRTKVGIHAQASLDLEEGYSFPVLQEWIQWVLSEIEWAERIKTLKTSLPEEDASTATPDIDLLREARQELERWLTSHITPAPPSQAGFISSMLLLSVGLFWLSFEEKLPWASLLVLVLPPLAHIGLARKKRQGEIESLQERYEGLEVPQPAEWEVSHVKDSVRKLDEHIRYAHRESLLEMDRRRCSDAEAEHQKVRSRITSVESELANMGFTPESDTTWLAHFLEDVQRWRVGRTETVVAETTRHKIESELTEKEKELSSNLKRWGEVRPSVSLKIETESCLERMENELERRKKNEFLELQCKQNRDQLNEKNQLLTAMCERIGLEEPNVAEVKHRVGFLESWKMNLRKSEALKSRISELEQSLGDQVSLTEHPLDDLESQISECQEARKMERDLRDRISKLEQQIEDQVHGRGLHEAQEALEDCRQVLQEERDRQLEIRMGMEILEWLRDQCKTRDRSEVLEEANRNLVMFSKGTLKLEVSIDEKDGEFRARREGLPPLSLNFLSSGERSQVLMAVRLAFLRQVEQVPLPLLVDEALGTTDDERGSEIMRALIAVSRQGRQIFYFTAQQDEVDKWREMLDSEGMSASLIDLAAERGLAEHHLLAPVVPVEKPYIEYRQLPDESMEAWMARLSIPAWDPHDSIDRLSLFFLLYDHTDLLQKAFEHGIDRVGKWILYNQSGALNDWVESTKRLDINQQIQVLKKIQEAWKIGRPPRVPEPIVAESPAVSKKFTESVLHQHKACEGDAARLIAAMDEGAVKGFRQQKIRDLEQEFREKGYLCDESPLGKDALRAKVMSEMEPGQFNSIHWDRLWGLFPWT